MTEPQNGGASAPPAANRAARRHFRGEHSFKAQSRRQMFAVAFDMWAVARERVRIERHMAADRAAAGLPPEGEL